MCGGESLGRGTPHLSGPAEAIVEGEPDDFWTVGQRLSGAVSAWCVALLPLLRGSVGWAATVPIPVSTRTIHELTMRPSPRVPRVSLELSQPWGILAYRVSRSSLDRHL
jgi:hypothetical protein